MRVCLTLAFTLLVATAAQAQTGACTESAVSKGNLPTADDAFAFMPPFGKPVIGRAGIQAAGAKSFSERTNITRSWIGDHRIVPTPSADMAYEYGTMRMGYDEGGKHNEFEAAILTVYKASNGVCQIVASTMHPLEEAPRR